MFEKLKTILLKEKKSCMNCDHRSNKVFIEKKYDVGNPTQWYTCTESQWLVKGDGGKTCESWLLRDDSTYYR